MEETALLRVPGMDPIFRQISSRRYRFVAAPGVEALQCTVKPDDKYMDLTCRISYRTPHPSWLRVAVTIFLPRSTSVRFDVHRGRTHQAARERPAGGFIAGCVGLNHVTVPS